MIPRPFIWMAAALAGALAHEVAHWLVWAVAGRAPVFDLWALTVRPTAGPSHVTPSDRIAAIAPYPIGLLAALVGWRLGHLPLLFFGAFMFQIPSAADLAAIRGAATWRLAPA